MDGVKVGYDSTALAARNNGSQQRTSRGSYNGYDHYAGQSEEDDGELGTPTTKEYLADLGHSYRERASSTSTAKDTKGRRYRASEDTMVTSPIGSI